MRLKDSHSEHVEIEENFLVKSPCGGKNLEPCTQNNEQFREGQQWEKKSYKFIHKTMKKIIQIYFAIGKNLCSP